MTSRLAWVLCCLALSAPLIGQSDDVDVPASMRRLRERDLASWERDDIIDSLLSVGERGAKPLLAYARGEQRVCSRRFDSARAAHLRDFEHAAERLWKRRFSPENRARVDVLRDEVLGFSRDPELTKETVQTEIDPRVAELRELLTLYPDEVMSTEERLSKSAVELRRESRTVAAWAGAAERAEEVLRAAGVRDDPPAEEESASMSALDIAAELAEDRGRVAVRVAMADERDRRVLVSNRAIAKSLDAEEAAGLSALDELRLLLGLPVLAIDTELCDAARDHSNDMRTLGFFSHTSPVEGKTTPAERAARFGTSGAGENIAQGQQTGGGAIRGWWYSPGHHRNMMGAYARVGLGRSETHWTQMFGG